MGVLTDSQKATMATVGFLRREIEAFDNATTRDGRLQDLSYHSYTFEAMVESRIRYWQRLTRLGWSRQKILSRLAKFYKRGGSPFEFLRLEYKPPEAVTEYVYARYHAARSRVSRVLGKVYGKRPGRPRETYVQPYPEMPTK